MAPPKEKPTPMEVIKAIGVLLAVCEGVSSYDNAESQKIHDDFIYALKGLHRAISRRTT